MDAHIDLRGTLRATDVATGLLILREAGGIYSIDGAVCGDMELSRRTTLNLMAASGGGLLEDIIGLLGQTRA
jgi:fructose-1,6-bisphosphatase/inositol monophosphatase family enzyme